MKLTNCQPFPKLLWGWSVMKNSKNIEHIVLTKGIVMFVFSWWKSYLIHWPNFLKNIGFSQFHFVHEFFSIVMDSGIFLFGILPWVWKVCDLTHLYCPLLHVVCLCCLRFIVCYMHYAEIWWICWLSWPWPRKWNFAYTGFPDCSYDLVTGDSCLLIIVFI